MDSGMRVVGIVLNGGASSRMGAPKDALILNGKTFLDIAKEKLMEVGVDEVLVSGSGGIPDSEAHKGPLMGLLTLAARCLGSGVLVTPVDMPLFPAILYRQLIEEGKKQTDSGLHFSESELPAFFFVNKRFILAVGALLESGSSGASIRNLHERVGSRLIQISSSEKECFTNINTRFVFEDLNSRVRKLEFKWEKPTYKAFV